MTNLSGFSIKFNHPEIQKIITSPQSIEVYEGQTATFTSSGIGSPIQWQKSTNGGATWTNISGANSSSYTTPITVRSTDNLNLFRVLFGNSISAVATLSVWNPLDLGGDLGVWLDPTFGLFQDRNGISASTVSNDGNPVGTWRARNGSINGTAPNDGQRPTRRTTGLNNTPCVEFFKSTSTLLAFTTSLASLFKNKNYGYLFASISPQTDSTQNVLIHFSSNAAGNVRATLITNRQSSGQISTTGRRLDANSFQAAESSSGAFTNNEVFIYGGEFLWGIANAHVRKNGSRIASNFSFQTTGFTSNTDSSQVHLSSASGSSFFNGKIGHVIAIAPQFEYTEQMINKIEGFLNYKTGNIY